MRQVTMIAGAMLAACQQQAGRPTEVEVATDVVAPANEKTLEEPPASVAPLRVSRFTTLDAKTCKLVDENRHEGPWWLRRCPGVDGYSVLWSESDLRQGLELVDAGGGKASLDLSAKVANGAFNALGSTIEWRGPSGKPADVLVVRVKVARPEGGPDISKLVVARLSPSSCVVAVIEPGAAQSAAARRIADAALPACLD